MKISGTKRLQGHEFITMLSFAQPRLKRCGRAAPGVGVGVVKRPSWAAESTSTPTPTPHIGHTWTDIAFVHNPLISLCDSLLGNWFVILADQTGGRSSAAMHPSNPGRSGSGVLSTCSGRRRRLSDTWNCIVIRGRKPLAMACCSCNTSCAHLGFPGGGGGRKASMARG